MSHTIGVKELRKNLMTYAKHAQAGQSYVVMKHAKPLFKISAVDEDDRWEEVIDFTQFKKRGVDINELLRRLQ